MKLMIGRVIKSHGIRGEVSIEAETDDPDTRFAVGELLDGKQGGREHTLTVESMRPHKGRLLVKFEEVTDRNTADSLRGTQFFAEPREAADDDSEGFYDHELEGLRVLHEGNEIGEITGVLHVSERQTLEVRRSGGGDLLIPFVLDIVPEVDLEAGTVTITPPEGLLEL